jgi:hypothetical protein
VLDTAAPDYHPTISGVWILFTRGDRTKTTAVLLFNRASGQLRQLASITAHGSRTFVYSGQVAGNYAVWGRVEPQGQDIYRYRISTHSNMLLRRSRGTFARYDPAIAPTGTAYWAQSTAACRPSVEIVRQALRGGPRVLTTIPAGADAGYMQAVSESGATKLLYSRFGYQGCETSRSTQTPGALFEIADHG